MKFAFIGMSHRMEGWMPVENCGQLLLKVGVLVLSFHFTRRFTNLGQCDRWTSGASCLCS